MLARTLLRASVRAPLAVTGIPAARFFSFKAEDQPRIRIGSTAPNFVADTTHGKIDFHEYIGDNWTVLFSHPKDYTPVCTTELGAFAKLKPEFSKRGVKLIALSVDDVASHKDWINDIEEVSSEGAKFDYPIIADESKEVAFKYDMLTEADFNNIDAGIVFTVRSVFIIDPNKKVRLIITYPASTGRNSAEILRVIDALQLADKKGIATPIDWTEGQDVIIPPTVSDADAAKKFGDFKKVKPYLRFTKA
ncbi:peroxiredoxin 1 [Scheffersomyces spartinae]|uniref:Peroxiredoxin 1 n=1 Tax=Scheffersomyces spartinae TaxID=45513 RepID=A0A9P7V6U8_9ASCO|nr:peroxiredoxin 1 [Scheffersomyces spartinae]KAG7192257.1 peroxiredoxin 1 [Scheffersomyces spartinae]